MRNYSLLEFVIQHANLKKGKNRLDVVIRNGGDEVLRNLILLLRSIDKNNILVEKSEQFIHALVPGKKISVDFQVSLRDSCSVFFSVTGFGNADDYFSTTSLPMKLVVEDWKHALYSLPWCGCTDRMVTRLPILRLSFKHKYPC
jgi:hypothetical protein